MLGLILAWLLAIGLSVPLFLYLRTHAGGFDQRLTDLGGPLLALSRGDVRPVLQTSWETILALLWADRQGVPYHYNIPGRAALPVYWAPFFLLGLGLFLRRSTRQPHAFLLIAALILGFIPALLSPGGPLYLRAIAAMPLVFLLVAGGDWAAGTWVDARLRNRLGRARSRLGFSFLITMLLGWHLFDNTTAYFVTWKNAAATQQIYNADLRAAAAYLNMTSSDQPVYISTDFWLDLDQQTYLLYEPLRRDVAWFYGPQGFPLPGDQDGVYVWTVSAPGNASLLQALERAGYREDPVSSPDVCCNLLTSAKLSRADVESAVQQLQLVPVTPALDFADTLQLVAAQASVAGNHIEVISRWAVVSHWNRSRPPKIAAVLTDSSGYVWGQSDDILAVAYQQWQTGQHFLQMTRIVLPADIPPGTYNVLLRIYDEAGGNLSISREGNALAAAPTVAEVPVSLFDDTSPAPLPPYLLSQPDPVPALQLLGSWERLGDLLVGVPRDLHVSWRATAALETAGLHFQLEATEQTDGRLLWSQDVTPVPPLPLTWPAGQTWRLTHRVEPQDLAIGTYQAVLKLCAQQGSNSLSCAIVGEAQVTSRPIVLSAPFQPQHLSGARWDNGVVLEGYDLMTAENVLQLTLLWRAQATPPQSLMRFVHLVDEQEQIVAQADGSPGTEGIAMSWWRPGEYVVDQVTLRLTEDSTSSRRLYVGYYDPITGRRVPVWSGDDVEQTDQRLPLMVTRGN